MRLIAISMLFLVGCGSDLEPIPSCLCDSVNEYYEVETNYEWVVEYVEVGRRKDFPCESGVYFSQVGTDDEGLEWGQRLRWVCEN